jgi:hypothetical protein
MLTLIDFSELYMELYMEFTWPAREQFKASMLQPLTYEEIERGCAFFAAIDEYFEDLNTKAPPGALEGPCS